MQRGLLTVHPDKEAWVKDVLPESHRVLAIKQNPHDETWLIEGPLMPEGDSSPVSLGHLALADTDGSILAIFWFSHATDHNWTRRFATADQYSQWLAQVTSGAIFGWANS